MSDRSYWDGVATEWLDAPRDPLWRSHSDAINAALCARWLGSAAGRILKTDLFDEAVSGGWYPLDMVAIGDPARVSASPEGFLIPRSEWDWFGLDLAPHIARAAARQRPTLHAVAADVRRLPWPAGAFDAILSTSTLDHLPTRSAIRAALGELARLLRPGGRLVITLDNPCNPALAVRSALPHAWLRAVGLAPYATGATLGPRALHRALSAAGLEVTSTAAVLHCPRAWAVVRARRLEQASASRRQRFLAALAAWEALAHWPTRWLTGYYVAMLAIKPEAS